MISSNLSYIFSMQNEKCTGQKVKTGVVLLESSYVSFEAR